MREIALGEGAKDGEGDGGGAAGGREGGARAAGLTAAEAMHAGEKKGEQGANGNRVGKDRRSRTTRESMQRAWRTTWRTKRSWKERGCSLLLAARREEQEMGICTWTECEFFRIKRCLESFWCRPLTMTMT